MTQAGGASSWVVLTIYKGFAALRDSFSLASCLQEIAGMPELPYEPVLCQCRTVLNPYCSIDYASHIWLCPLW